MHFLALDLFSMAYICTVMDRKTFLRNSLLGAAAAAGGTAAARLLNDPAPETVGFEHLPTNTPAS